MSLSLSFSCSCTAPSKMQSGRRPIDIAECGSGSRGMCIHEYRTIRWDSWPTLLVCVSQVIIHRGNGERGIRVPPHTASVLNFSCAPSSSDVPTLWYRHGRPGPPTRFPGARGVHRVSLCCLRGRRTGAPPRVHPRRL